MRGRANFFRGNMDKYEDDNRNNFQKNFQKIFFVFTLYSYFCCRIVLRSKKQLKRVRRSMAKKQLTELVNKLKKAGIKASLTKPKSNYLLSLQQIRKYPSSVN
jgi:hypothetical protein